MKEGKMKIPVCTTSDHLKRYDGQTAAVEGVLKPPSSKRFPPIIYMKDGIKVAFVLSEKLERELVNVRKYYDRQVQMTGVIYVKNLPENFESHLDLPYVVEVENVEVVH